jgi:hypothetical protein
MSYTILKIYDEVLQDPRLRSLEEKLIVSHILQFQNEGKNCFTSNARIARFLDRSEDFVHQTIFSLSKRGIVRLKQNKGTARMLQIVTPGSILECAEAQQKDIFEY